MILDEDSAALVSRNEIEESGGLTLKATVVAASGTYYVYHYQLERDD